MESQFEDAATTAETCMDTVEESTVKALPSENIVDAPPSENIVQGISRPGKPGCGSDPWGMMTLNRHPSPCASSPYRTLEVTVRK